MIKSKRTALLIALALILSAFMPWAEPSDSFIINNADDFAALARLCKTDTNSQGLTVELAGDIDLSKNDFAPIPTFGGHFNGNGYTVSGLNITANGSYTGLFLYSHHD